MQIFHTELIHSDVVMMSVLMRLVIWVCCTLSVKCSYSELESWSPDDYGTLRSMLQTSNGLRLIITGQTGVYKVDAVKFQLLSKLNVSGISNMIHNRTATDDYVTVCSNQNDSCLVIDPLGCKDYFSKLMPAIKIDGVAAFMATNTRGAERSQNENFLFVGCPHVQGQEKLGGRCTEPGISWYLNSGKNKSDPWYGFKSYNDTPVLTDKYIDAFSVDKYRVFFSLQRVVEPGTKRSRLAQVCQYNDKNDGKDSTPYTYADMPIKCGQLGEIRAVKKVEFQTQTIFVAVFSESTKSAVCVFTMTNITKMFVENIKDCYRGIRVPKNEDYADYPDSDIPCSNKTADNDISEKKDDDFLCNTDNLSVYRQIIGNKTMFSQPVVEYDDDQLTAVAVSVLDSKIFATFGTAKGAILKAIIYPRASVVKIKKPGIHNFGRDVLHDMYTSPDDEHIYVLTRKQVYKLPVQPCSSYSSCDDCIQSYPDCKWCTVDDSCVYKGRGCHKAYLSEQCFKGKITPAAVPAKDIQTIRLVGFNMPTWIVCYYGFGSTVTFIRGEPANLMPNVTYCKLEKSSIQSIENRTKDTCVRPSTEQLEEHRILKRNDIPNPYEVARGCQPIRYHHKCDESKIMVTRVDINESFN